MSPTQRETPSKPKCKAKARTTGRRCTNPPIRGGTVCRMHGGAAPQVRAKAEEQLRLARDELMEMLLGIARDVSASASERLKAITWALERAGFKASVGVDLTVDPGWMQALKGLVAGRYEDPPELFKQPDPLKVEAHAGPPMVVQADDKLPDTWR